MYEEGNDRIEGKLNIVKIAKQQTDVKVLLKNSMLNDEIMYQIRHSQKNCIDLDASSESETEKEEIEGENGPLNKVGPSRVEEAVDYENSTLNDSVKPSNANDSI